MWPTEPERIEEDDYFDETIDEEDLTVDIRNQDLPGTIATFEHLDRIYVLWHFHDNYMDCNFIYLDLAEARKEFLKNMMESANDVLESKDYLHAVSIAETADRWVSTIYHRDRIREGDICYPDKGDRWVLETVLVPAYMRQQSGTTE